MSVKERILSLRIIRKAELNREFLKELGVTAVLTIRENKEKQEINQEMEVMV